MSETWLEIVVSYCGDSLTKTKKIASYFQYSGYTEDEVRSLFFLMPGSFCLAGRLEAEPPAPNRRQVHWTTTTAPF